MEPTRSAKAKDFLAKVLPAGLESLPGPGDAMESLAPQARPAGPLEAAVESASRKLQTGEALALPEQFALEAIIIPDKRPAIDVVDGDFQVTHPLWLHLNADPARANLRRALPSIGRIELPGHPTLPYGGTGFVVGRDLLMTNRHVAEIFTNGLGMRDLVFRQGLSAGIDFVRERGSPPEGRVLAVRHVEMIHPYWDMALLRVEGLDSTHAPLKLSLLQPEALAGRDVAVIGYPAFDPRNAADVQNTVFGGVYYVKRMQPGKLNGRGAIDSFGKSVAAATHDSSTLGGNSGSAVVDVATGQVVGLHFAGVYLQSNYAVPTAELARDGRVDGFDLDFEGEPRPEAGLWSSWWDPTESGPAGAPVVIQTAAAPSATASALPPPQAAPADSVASPAHPAELRWTVPIEITVRVGEGQASAAVSSAASAPAVEAMVEPAHDTDYDDRKGYDPDFLGVAAPLPEATDPAVLSRPSGGGLLLRYRHFSVALHKGRRLALFTASNIDLSPAMRQAPDGGSLTRKALSGLGDHDMEKWFLDPRAPAADQLPDRFFTKDKGAFDKGHIVRREDVAWGANFDEIRSANGDTFHVTNCSPQVAGYNRPKQATNWGDLEQYVSKQAGGGRLSLFAGPVLADDDPFFAGVDDSGRTRVRIPRRFWKVVLARSGAALQAFAFVLEQDLADTPLEFAVEEKWRHALLSIAELERELRLVRFPPAIHAADQAGGPAGAAVAKLAGSRPSGGAAPPHGTGRARGRSGSAATAGRRPADVPRPFSVALPVRGRRNRARGTGRRRGH